MKQEKRSPKMAELDEIRWQLVKAMLEEFPQLKRRVENYLHKR